MTNPTPSIPLLTLAGLIRNRIQTHTDQAARDTANGHHVSSLAHQRTALALYNAGLDAVESQVPNLSHDFSLDEYFKALGVDLVLDTNVPHTPSNPDESAS